MNKEEKIAAVMSLIVEWGCALKDGVHPEKMNQMNEELETALRDLAGE